MNKKIKELAIKSICKYGIPSYDEMSRGKYTHSQYNSMIEDTMTEFAELVARECMDLCLKQSIYYLEGRKATFDFNLKNIMAEGEISSSSLLFQIKEHFGIKD